MKGRRGVLDIIACCFATGQARRQPDAVVRGDEAAVRSWLERGGRANTAHEYGEVTGVTLLMDAAGQGHERVADLLLRHDAEATVQNSKGYTALMRAATEGHERVVDLLLRGGAEIELQDSDGFTALMRAAQQGHERVVELLLQHGAEINLRDRDGRNPLIHAAINGHNNVLTKQGFNHVAVCQRATECLSTYRVIEQDVGKLTGRIFE